MIRRSTIFFVGVAVLLAAMFVVQYTSARNESQTVDEGVHLTAGYSYWKTGDFRLNPEHPPLIKLIASVPLLFLPIHLPIDSPSWEERDQWTFAREFLYRNAYPADTILLLGRLPIMALGLLLGVLIAIWAKQLWGISGGLLALTLYAFDPTVLAHSRYVTTDVGVTLLFVATIFFFGRFLERPSLKRWWPVALLFALAQVAKFSAVTLWIILPVLWLLRILADEHRRALGWRTALLFFLSLLVATNIMAFFLYRFEVRAPLNDPQFAAVYDERAIWTPEVADEQPGLAQAVLKITNPDSSLGRSIRSAFANVPLPAYTFFRGLSHVVWHNYWGHSSYLLGDFRALGWWYYFPVAFLVKTPLATMVLLAATLVYISRLTVERFYTYRRRKTFSRPVAWLLSFRSADFQYTLLLVPPLIYFAISMTSHINLGVRHLLPIYPFLFILIGNLVTVRFQRWQRLWQGALIGIVTMLLASSAITYPHYLAYFSELVGGPEYGARYLTDSNLDWGQELKRLGQYVEQHDIPFVYITYFGQAPLETYLKDFRYLPRTNETERIAQLDGWVAISATALFSSGGDYDWLRAKHPTEKIGYAIFLYDLRKNK